MDFAIQASNPRTTCRVSGEDSTLGEAIETIFPLATEFLLIVWNGVYVPLTYKYDVSVIIDDVLRLVSCIRDAEEGQLTLDWPSSTFRSRWVLAWSKSQVNVHARWESVIGGTESLLNDVPTITVDKVDFLSEWVVMLEMVSKSVRERSVGVKVAFDLSLLDGILATLPSRGRLYKV